MDALVRRLEVKISKDQPLTGEELDFLRAQSRTTEDAKVVSSIMSCFQWLNDPANIPYIVPHLNKGDAYAAKRAIWTLCWLGAGEQFKDYMIQCLEPGMPWDTKQDLATGVLRAAGHHLRTHRDRDLAQLLVRWRPRRPLDPFFDSNPLGLTSDALRRVLHSAEMGMGYAVGADPLALTDDPALVNASVARFLAERQDG